jgi:hypothetical protein
MCFVCFYAKLNDLKIGQLSDNGMKERKNNRLKRFFFRLLLNRNFDQQPKWFVYSEI